jgi:hypothetical protein
MDSCPNCGGVMEAAVAPDDIPTDFGTVHAPAVPIERCKVAGLSSSARLATKFALPLLRRRAAATR